MKVGDSFKPIPLRTNALIRGVTAVKFVSDKLALPAFLHQGIYQEVFADLIYCLYQEGHLVGTVDRKTYNISR